MILDKNSQGYREEYDGKALNKIADMAKRYVAADEGSRSFVDSIPDGTWLEASLQLQRFQLRRVGNHGRAGSLRQAAGSGGTGGDVVTIEFYWQDLTPQKQAEIMETLGDNGNWDVIPFCTLEIEDDEN